LPANFAESVLDLELQVESGRFSIETINELMFLYSQAVEYYNGINDDKQNSWQDKIQNMLLRPEILMVMQNASKDPDAHKKEAEQKKERMMSMAPDELERLR